MELNQTTIIPDQSILAETKKIKLIKPIIWGMGAVLISSSLWAAITIFSGWEIGYVGIGAAALISIAVLKAAKQIRSRKLQYLAIVLTVLCILAAHVEILVYWILKEAESQFN